MMIPVYFYMLISGISMMIYLVQSINDTVKTIWDDYDKPIWAINSLNNMFLMLSLICIVTYITYNLSDKLEDFDAYTVNGFYFAFIVGILIDCFLVNKTEPLYHLILYLFLFMISGIFMAVLTKYDDTLPQILGIILMVALLYKAVLYLQIWIAAN